MPASGRLDHDPRIFRRRLVAAEHFFQPARVEVALQTAHAIEDELAVQVIDLVLQRDGEQPFGVDFKLFFFFIERLELDARGAFDLDREIDDAETAFFPKQLALAPGDFGVDQLQQVLAGVVVVDIEHDDAARDTDLRRGEATPGAAYMVSTISSIRRTVSEVTLVTGFATCFSMGSGYFRISSSAITNLYS